MRKTKKCLHCGKEFSTQSAVKKYCCVECADVAKQEQKKRRERLLRDMEPMAELAVQDYLTFSKAAVLMGCSRQYVYKLVQQGKLPASRLSSRMAFVKRSDIERMLDESPYHRVLPGRVSKSARKSQAQTKGREGNKTNIIVDAPMEYYSGEEVMKLYKVNQSWLYTCAKRAGIPICRIAGRTYYSKRHVDEHFGMAIDYSNIEEWLTTDEVKAQYGMSSTAIHAYTYRHRIPTKREYGVTYYSKQHLDECRKPDLAADDRYYSTAEACEILGVTSYNLTHIVRRHHIATERVGVKNILLKTDVERALQERKAIGL